MTKPEKTALRQYRSWAKTQRRDWIDQLVSDWMSGGSRFRDDNEPTWITVYKLRGQVTDQDLWSL